MNVDPDPHQSPAKLLSSDEPDKTADKYSSHHMHHNHKKYPLYRFPDKKDILSNTAVSYYLSIFAPFHHGNSRFSHFPASSLHGSQALAIPLPFSLAVSSFARPIPWVPAEKHDTPLECPFYRVPEQREVYYPAAPSDPQRYAR